MEIFTIGFTKKSAEKFFLILGGSKIECVVDVRLRPDSQLSGFTKKDDLAFFLGRLLDCDYRHIPELAPTSEILDTYRKDKNWAMYAQSFNHLMDQRGIPGTLDGTIFEEKRCCLLCSETEPDHCHRRLVAERLAKEWNATIKHL